VIAVCIDVWRPEHKGQFKGADVFTVGLTFLLYIAGGLITLLWEMYDFNCYTRRLKRVFEVKDMYAKTLDMDCRTIDWLIYLRWYKHDGIITDKEYNKLKEFVQRRQEQQEWHDKTYADELL
jgi:hypothetical protein